MTLGLPWQHYKRLLQVDGLREARAVLVLGDTNSCLSVIGAKRLHTYFPHGGRKQMQGMRTCPKRQTGVSMDITRRESGLFGTREALPHGGGIAQERTL